MIYFDCLQIVMIIDPNPPERSKNIYKQMKEAKVINKHKPYFGVFTINDTLCIFTLSLTIMIT